MPCPLKTIIIIIDPVGGVVRQCAICGGTKTSIQRRKKDYPNWYKHYDGDTGEYICSSCYHKKRHDEGKVQLVYPVKRFCVLCKSTQTKLKKDGTPWWYFHKKSGSHDRICYKCKLKEAREKSAALNKAGACDHDICVEARKGNTTNGYDYIKYNHCVRCITNHPKSLKYCPCCHAIMRTKPRKTSSKQTMVTKHGLKPPVYY